MIDTIELLELVYNYLKSLGHSESFENIWNSITNKHNLVIYGDSKEEIIADLYTELVLDNRFVLTNDGLWALREFLKYEEIKKQYEYIDQFETTEEFGDIDLDSDIDATTLSLNESLIDEEEINDNEEESYLSEVEYDNDLVSSDLAHRRQKKVSSNSDLENTTDEIDWNAIEIEIDENN